MPASAVASAAAGNAFLAAINGGMQWSGEITYNRVDRLNPDETARFAQHLPSTYTTDAVGLTNAMWGVVVNSLRVMQTYAAFTYSLSDALDANYMISDFYRADNRDVAGIAAEPGATPIMAFNINTWTLYTPQLQAWISLHELGHTLGLSHPEGLAPALDFSQFSIMSYNWFQLGDETFGEGLPLTPMALDVALLQAKYGAAAANTGDTRYALSRFFSDVDGPDGLVQNGGGFVCIWDSGGLDTLAYGGTTGALLNLNAATLDDAAYAGDLADVIGDVAALSRRFAGFDDDLKAELTDPTRSAGGFFSSLLDAGARERAGYTIAAGARIEAASGGSGDDLLIGNAAANRLAGNDGRDDLFGGSGDDSLDGGLGDDQAFGGQGSDTIADGGGANYLRGDEGDDRVDGGAGFDDINGNMGADTATGGLGDDWVVGGKDNDLLSGGEGGDLVYGNLGSDTIAGDAGGDTVRGGQQDDSLSGGAGDDYLSGDRDADTITGGGGADLFHTFGDAGIDRVLDFSLADGDRVLLDPGTQFTVAQMGADTVVSMTGGGQMILVGVSMASLTPGWIFGA